MWALPTLRGWAADGITSLREVSREHVLTALPDSGNPRYTTGSGLRGIFKVLKTHKIVFVDPTARLKLGAPESRTPLPADLAMIREGLDSSDPARAAMTALLAFHALRAGQIRRRQLTDVRDGRVHLTGKTILPAEPVRVRLAAYLNHRSQRWPNTANPHLFIHYRSALGLSPVGGRWLAIVLGTAARVIRTDRILDEVIATGGDRRRICDLFGMSVAGAKRYTAVLDHPDLAELDRQCPTVTDTDRELLRAIFGQDAELYDQARPGYPAPLFVDLTQLAGLTARSRVLEIGCGTGQATRPLAQLGCSIVAVELSPEMAEMARRNLHQFPNVTIDVSPFEQWTPPATPFDLVVSATAFHWIDPEIRVHKAADILSPDGTLALIHSEHVAGGTERFFIDAQDCYERFDPKTTPGWRQEHAADIPDDSSEIDGSHRFGPAQFRRYEWEQSYTTPSYLDLLMTYSPTRSLPQPAREGLLACLGNLIDRDHHGHITKRNLTQLTLAHRTT